MPFRTTLDPNSRQAGLVESACRSPTRLTDASASSRAVFSESDRRSVDCSGSKGGPFKALSTVGRSHVGTVRGRGGFNLLAPFRKRTTELSLPTDWPAIGAWKAAIAATNTLSVEWERPLSSSSCRKDRITANSEVEGFSPRLRHQVEKTDHLRA